MSVGSGRGDIINVGGLHHGEPVPALAQLVLDLVEAHARDGLVGVELLPSVTRQAAAQGLGLAVDVLPDLPREPQHLHLQLRTHPPHLLQAAPSLIEPSNNRNHPPPSLPTLQARSSSEVVLVLDHLVVEPVLVVVVVVFAVIVEGGVRVVCGSSQVLPVPAGQVEVGEVVLRLHHLLVELVLVERAGEGDGDVVALQLQPLDVEGGHLVVLAGLEELAADALLGLRVEHGLTVQFKLMGNAEYREQELAQYRPQLHNYTLAHCYSPLSIYRNLYTSEELMEFKESLYSTQDVDRKVQTFVARYQHIYLVSSLFMSLQAASNCANNQFDLTIYYERVVTNLSKINEISFRDSLHCLAVALKGFQILYKNFGYFEVFENMFHISQRGRLKVWCNQNIYKTVPEQYLLGEGREEDMVVKVLNIVDANTDDHCRLFPLRDTLLALPKLTFANAIVALRQICRENNFLISEQLESLENFAQFQSVLDIYAPPKRFPKDTQITFHPNPQPQHRERPARTTPMRSSSSSSHRTGNHVAASEHGKSLEVSRNGRNSNGLQLTTAQEDEFPKFVAGRKKTPSKSQESSSRKVSNSPNFKGNLPEDCRAHPHLQQFSKMRPEDSQLRKKAAGTENREQVSRYSYASLQPPQQEQPMVYAYRPATAQPTPSPMQPPSFQQPAPHAHLQRHTSAPRIVYAQPQPAQPNYQQVVRNAAYAPSFPAQPVQPTNSQYYVRRVEQPTTNYRYPIHHNQQTHNQQPYNQQVHTQPQQSNLLRPNHYIASQPTDLQKSRGLSVPVKLTYQGTNSKEFIISPKKNHQQTKPQPNSSPNDQKISYPKDRLVTLGQISANKNDPEPRIDKKDDRFQLMQLESKIEMLESFADNKITTQEFLPNQSHALSNIKWEKNSNSGRDSVTSAFRKDILLELSSKPSDKKTLEDKKEDRRDQKHVSKFDDNGYYTNQRLLELIKTGTSTRPASKLTFEEKMKKYDRRYAHPDAVKETPKESKEADPADFYNDLYRRYSQKSGLFGEETNTPTFGHEGAAFKKKSEAGMNKICAISEKWEEENICSTSNGSRGRNVHNSNIDEDILEDMHNEGFGMLFKKGR